MRTLLAAVDRMAPSGTARRTALTVTMVALVAGTVAQVALPEPTPQGVVARGLLTGCANALLAAGLVLVFRSARIVNFAQAAMGGAAAYLCFALVQFIDVPFFLALPVAIVGAALTGLIVDLLFVQRFFTAPRLVLTVVTIVLARFLGDSRSFVDAIPGIGSAARSIKGALALEDPRMRLPFEDFKFHIFPFDFGLAAVLTVGLTVLALGGLGAFLHISRIGTAVRGAATNAERASSLGINVRSLSSVVWAISGLLSGIAALTVLMNDGFGAASGPEVLIPALAAAVLARMSSIPVAVSAALGLSVLQAAMSWSYRNSPVAVAYLVVIAAALLVQRRHSGRSEEGQTSSWEVTREIRPVPAELDRVPGIRRARVALVVVVLVLVAVYPFASSNAQTNLGSLIFIQALIGLSLVVLTGWGGQVSLGQFALVAIAAVLGGHLTADSGISFWITLPVVAAVTAGLAAALGVPALRIRGSFLAVTTLAFAVATQYLLFDTEVFRGLIPTRVYRPGFLFVSFASERSYYFLCLGFLVMAAFVVSRLRRSRPGRVLIALRENEAGVQAFGVPAGRTRIAAFALSGALCGTAGVLFVHHQRAVDAVSFGSVVSVEMFIMAMIGGVTSVAGALLGAAYVGIANFLLPSEVARNLVTSGGLLALLFVAPGGLAAVAAGARDAVLRIVATRQQIPVPSLFADMDYEAIRSQRAPLVEPIPYHGLEAIPVNRRYTGHSELHGRPRARQAEGVRG